MKKQRVIFCTYSSIYSSLVLETLLQANTVEVVGIVNSTRLLKPSYNGLTGSLRFIQATGWRYATYLFFITDFFKLLQPVSRLNTVHKLAKKHKLPLIDTVDINREKEIQLVTALAPDVLLSAHFNQLFKEPILALPKLAAINIHPSLLPAYKGVDPVFYGLLAKEKRLGVTAHLIDQTFDTGMIIEQRSFPADSFDDVFSHNRQLFQAGGEIAIEAIHHLVAEKACLVQKNKGDYDSWPSRIVVKQLKNQGTHLIRLFTYFSAVFFWNHAD